MEGEEEMEEEEEEGGGRRREDFKGTNERIIRNRSTGH